MAVALEEDHVDDKGDADAEEIWKLLNDDRTYVYVAGLAPVRDALDKLFATLSGSNDAWAIRKARLVDAGRWVELLY